MSHFLSDPPAVLALGQLGWTQMIVLGLLGVLIFGKRLPEVGKSLGKGIVEFKKGLSGIDTDVENAGGAEAPAPRRLDAAPADPVNLANPNETTAAPATPRPDAAS